jgi:cytochrome c556
MDSVKNLPRASERLLETRTALTQLQRQWQSGHAGAAEIDKLDAAYQRAAGSCVACHEEYRDRTK